MPTFLDIQSEDWPQLLQAKYDGESVHEWNTDGMAKYNILNLLQKIVMLLRPIK